MFRICFEDYKYEYWNERISPFFFSQMSDEAWAVASEVRSKQTMKRIWRTADQIWPCSNLEYILVCPEELYSDLSSEALHAQVRGLVSLMFRIWSTCLVEQTSGIPYYPLLPEYRDVSLRPIRRARFVEKVHDLVRGRLPWLVVEVRHGWLVG